MKKVLETELLSMAHRILRMKNKDVDNLLNDAKNLYEKLLILKFYQNNFELGLIKDISQEELDQKLEQYSGQSMGLLAEQQRHQMPQDLLEQDYPLVIDGDKEELDHIQQLEKISPEVNFEIPAPKEVVYTLGQELNVEDTGQDLEKKEVFDFLDKVEEEQEDTQENNSFIVESIQDMSMEEQILVQDIISEANLAVGSLQNLEAQQELQNQITSETDKILAQEQERILEEARIAAEQVAFEEELLLEQEIAAEQEALEQEIAAEQARIAAEQAALEQERILEQEIAAEQARIAAEQAALEQERILEQEIAAEQARIVAEQAALEQERILEQEIAAEQARIAAEQEALEQERILEQEIAAEQARIVTEQEALEQKRILEEARIAAEQEALEQERILEQEIAAEQARIAAEQEALEQERILEQEIAAEQARIVAEQEALEQERILEQEIVAEQARIAAEQVTLEQTNALELARLLIEKEAVERERLAEMQRIQEEKDLEELIALEEQIKVESREASNQMQEGLQDRREVDPFEGFNFMDLNFERVTDSNQQEAKESSSITQEEQIASNQDTLFNLESTSVTQPHIQKAKSINDIYNNTISVGLNDRIAFEKNLFGGSGEDFNRVLSQLNTVSSFAEAQSLIDHLVKPEYGNWEGKQEYEDRFMSIIEKRFN